MAKLFPSSLLLFLIAGFIGLNHCQDAQTPFITDARQPGNGLVWTWIACTRKPKTDAKLEWTWLYDDQAAPKLISGLWYRRKCAFGVVDVFATTQTSYAEVLSACKAQNYQYAQPRDGLHPWWNAFQAGRDVKAHFRNINSGEFGVFNNCAKATPISTTATQDTATLVEAANRAAEKAKEAAAEANRAVDAATGAGESTKSKTKTTRKPKEAKKAEKAGDTKAKTADNTKATKDTEAETTPEEKPDSEKENKDGPSASEFELSEDEKEEAERILGSERIL